MENKYTILKNYFGYEEFRNGQEHLIDCILNGKDVVAIMPTGAGKSICFQVPAMLFSGVTIVISPLISLMKDQVNGLNQIGIRAAYINSSLTFNQNMKALENAKNGVYKIIYVAPERLLTDSFINFAININISMITVDEAHCISQWGQDFRPSYTKINEFIEMLNIRPVVSCFTATATDRVQVDIANQLELTDYEFLVTGFDRKNLYFQVEKPRNKKNELLNFLEDKKEESGIVYCNTRKDVESVADFLVANGYNAKAYHAGLSDVERHKNQDDFIFDRINIIVATNAFGMGIDKSNVTYVVHFNMPKDIESYFQEAGRAGRDGSESTCVIFFAEGDVQTNLFLIEEGHRDESIDRELLETIKLEDRTRLKMMSGYCRTRECLRSYILNYFGETLNEPCGKCSNCNNDYIIQDITIDAQKILSCIVRLDERYGIKRVIDVLNGSKSKNVLEWGLDKLPTYGILNKPKREIRDIIDFLELHEYVYTTNDKYPLLKLGARSKEVLKEKKKIEMKVLEAISIKEVEPKKHKMPKELNEKDKELFDSLKNVRYKISGKEGVPAFMIFHNSTLVEMCKTLPTNKSELLRISGIGGVKSEKYGKYFIDAINEYLGSV
ncbi:MAG: DNA helicase RecQ [Lachnospirales bacterium]